jgi:SM-20-related protein
VPADSTAVINLTSRSTAAEPPDETLFATIASELETRGYAICPAALPAPVSDSLLAALAAGEGEFAPAAIGRGDEAQRNRFVRRDTIYWLDGAQPHAAAWRQWCEALRLYLNQRLFLGLFSFESHLAHYAPGDFYKRHRDAFHGESNRLLSVVAYLNRGWQPSDGGELVIYPDDDQAAGELLRVTPSFASLVVFLSEEFPHEVLPAQRDRYSVAGWFRLNSTINGQLDPPR